MSSMSEQNPIGPQDLLHYAPRRLREKPQGIRLSVVEDAPDTAQPVERSDHVEMPAPSQLDARVETAVFRSLRHALDPHLMDEPPELTIARDRRAVVLKIAARFAAATGVAAVVALFFVNIVPASRQTDAGSSFVKAVESLKTTTQASAATHEPVEVKGEHAEAKPDKADVKAADVKAIPALSQFQPLLTSSADASPPPKPDAASGNPLLQQFMQWDQNMTQSDKGQ